MKSYKVLSALLSYPTAELQAAARDSPALLEAEGLVPAKDRRSLAELVEELATRDLMDLQERYVLLFDRSRSLSLHLFEHVHGESRDRGQAMVDLLEQYRRAGLDLDCSELPDYLPLFLEYLSVLPEREAREQLALPLNILSALRERLSRRRSSYAAVLAVLERLAGGKPDAGEVSAILAEEEDDPEDMEALDRRWEEEAVTFGPGAPGAGGCPKVSDMLARMAPDPKA